ncbi:MAG: diaminopimelate decarboxylase [Actinomycetota bacterium]|nr:diaminopimelate decarboxylase [Actinomycetota bacterium]
MTPGRSDAPRLDVTAERSSDAPVEPSLLPDGAEFGSDGRLSIAGVDVAELCGRFGTPVFVYDEDHLRRRCREAVTAWGDGVAYASKAFLCTAMARLAVEEGMSIDVSTGGELHVALVAGVPGERLVLHGNNKSDIELTRALEVGVGRIVVDSFDEADRLDRLAPQVGVRPDVLVRVTPGIEAHTHEYVRTGQDDSKFGFGLGSGAAAAIAARLSSPSSAVRLVGLHVHIGSQIFEPEFFALALETVAPLVSQLGLSELCVGGGLGVGYVAGEPTPSITDWARTVRAAGLKAGLDPSVRLTAEPGRSIVADAAVTCYTVGTIKVIPGVRTYVSVDGGMSDNPRPVLYGSGYEAFAATDGLAARPSTATVVGKHCESGDIVVRDARLPVSIAIGDVLVTPVTGAYGHSMASNYNKVPRPPVVFASQGRARLVVRRESYDDLVALDIDEAFGPEWGA